MDLAEVRERMEDGRLYRPDDPALMDEQRARCALAHAYNQTGPYETKRRAELLVQMLAEVGEGATIEPPFLANWGGAHLHVGRNFYANMGLTLVDDADIFIGDDVLLGPHVTLCTGTHPDSPHLRAAGAQYNRPIHIGNRVWVGAGAIVLPGVRIGDGSVIGAGSVVTRDVPSDVVAVGNPCRVLRAINAQDDLFYDGTHPVDAGWDA